MCKNNNNFGKYKDYEEKKQGMRSRANDPTKKPNGLLSVIRLYQSRGDRIRTCDHLVPNQERYRTALHPVKCQVYGLCGICPPEFRLQRYIFFVIPPRKILFFLKSICLPVLQLSGCEQDEIYSTWSRWSFSRFSFPAC